MLVPLGVALSAGCGSDDQTEGETPAGGAAPESGTYIEVNGKRFEGQRLVAWCHRTRIIRKDFRDALKSAGSSPKSAEDYRYALRSAEYAEADEICGSVGE